MPVSSGRPAAFQAAVPPASTLTGRRLRKLGRGIAGDPAVLAGQHQIALRRQFVERLGEPGADREPGARDVTLAVLPAQRQIDHDGRVRLQLGRAARVAGSGPASGKIVALRRRACRAPVPPSSPPSSTAASQPMRRSQDAVMRALTPVSSTSTTRAPQTPSQLSVSWTNWPPGAIADARQMAGAVFGRVAHIDDIEGAPVGLALPFRERRAVDDRNAVAPGHGLGALPRRGDALGRHLRGPRGGPRHDPEPGEVPRHRAVLQRDDPVRHAGVDQGLRADDAARPPAAIDDDEGVRRRHQLAGSDRPAPRRAR